ncbi:MAG: hypothetical protein ACC655_10380, partial [Rhodothermia bacterium]
MEKRVLLAVALSIGLIFLVNVVFPPVREPVPLDFETPAAVDSPTTQAGETRALIDEEFDLGGLPVAEPVAEPMARIDPGAAPVRGDTIVVRSGLYEHVFSTVGATIVG